MGRLFWKFLFVFWLAQVVTVISATAVNWLFGDVLEFLPDRSAPGMGPPPPHRGHPGMGPPPPYRGPPGMRPPPRHQPPDIAPPALPYGQASMESPQADDFRGLPPVADSSRPLEARPLPGGHRENPDQRPGGAPPSWFPPIPKAPVIIGTVISLIFAALLAWYFSRPIYHLRDAFEAVASGKLETRVGHAIAGRKDELGDLGIDFDRMAERIQNLVDTQQRLLHNVSHELRSPLARMQAAIGLMSQQPERGAEFAERMERDTARMDQLIGELLTLARLDAGMKDQLDDVVDLDKLVTDIVEGAQLEAETKDRVIVARLKPVGLIRGSDELLYSAIDNVVRNAIRYSPAGGTIEISSDATGGKCRIVISDQGPGVPESELTAIFDPFYRSGSSRQTDGHGLGLAITRQVMDAHGGRVSATNRPSGGLVVTLELPLGFTLHNATETLGSA